MSKIKTFVGDKLNRVGWAFVVPLIFGCACIGTKLDDHNRRKAKWAKAR